LPCNYPFEKMLGFFQNNAPKIRNNRMSTTGNTGSHDLTPSPHRPIVFWCVIAILLLTWNGTAATFASPFVLLHRYDCVQYQLLARNRLHGHYEVGDQTHTVHQEGCHPMWRPGLVWIEEGLARCLGSVRQAAAAASALGTTLLELALLALAWCSFGKKTFIGVLLGFAVPAVSLPFLVLAVGQGAEVWAAAASVAGLTLLVTALKQLGMGTQTFWAVASGTVAGLSEWFRTGNIMLFAVPCAVYTLAALREQIRRQNDFLPCSPSLLVSLSPCLPPAMALTAWAAVAALANQAVPSSVNKTVANLWDCRADMGGPAAVDVHPDGTRLVHFMLGYSLVPAGRTEFPIGPSKSETYFDYAVESSRGRNTLDYCREHGEEIGRTYLQHLEQVVTHNFWGLRQTIGKLVLVLFGVQFLVCIGQGLKARRPGKTAAFSEDAASHTFALAGGALGHYLGPVVLIAGDAPIHYILVALPLFILIAVRGGVRLVDFAAAGWKRFNRRGTGPASDVDTLHVLRPFVALTGAALVGLSACSYGSAFERLKELQQLSAEQQAAVNALGLDGKKVACRNMSWFVDQEVETFLLPYATVPELEVYVRDHNIDGILIWEEEPTPFFKATPYESTAAFEQALHESALFGGPRVLGTWLWYPVMPTTTAKERP
jgi:hypothetical protein